MPDPQPQPSDKDARRQQKQAARAADLKAQLANAQDNAKRLEAKAAVYAEKKRSPEDLERLKGKQARASAKIKQLTDELASVQAP